MRHLPSDWVGIANAWMPTLILNVAHAVQPAASYMYVRAYIHTTTYILHMYYMGAGWVDPRSYSRGNFFLLLNIWRAELLRRSAMTHSNIGFDTSPQCPAGASIASQNWARGALCVEMGFTWTSQRNQDATMKSKSKLISNCPPPCHWRPFPGRQGCCPASSTKMEFTSRFWIC